MKKWLSVCARTCGFSDPGRGLPPAVRQCLDHTYASSGRLRRRETQRCNRFRGHARNQTVALARRCDRSARSASHGPAPVFWTVLRSYRAADDPRAGKRHHHPSRLYRRGVGATRAKSDMARILWARKTFLSATAGVAFDKHMIRDVNDRVLDYVHPSPDFELPHNQPITWDEMLRQTSGLDGHDVERSRGGRIVLARTTVGTNSPQGRRRLARSGNIPTCA